MKGRDGPTGRAKLFTRDFRRNLIRGIELCIDLCIADTISNIYSFDSFSRIQKVKFKTSWSSIFKKL